MAEVEAEIERRRIPPKLKFLLEPAPYKVTPHGRGSGTSWSCARVLLQQGKKERLRVPCARETMQSIKDSVHTLLKEQIERLQYERFYEVRENAVEGKNGTLFTFHGLKHNVSGIKSLEGSDRFWVEEAESVSKASWDVLEPTVFRRPTSELWINFNPQLDTDETMTRFVTTPRPKSVVQHLTYRDNPWFPEFLDVLRRDDLAKMTTEDYENIWEGKCRSAVVGAVYGEELKACRAEDRICRVPVDRTKPVDTFWDLGFGDATAIWFAQAVNGWYHIVDYLEDSGETIEHYLIQLQNRGYLYGTDWVPHDAVDTIIHKRLSGDRSRSIEGLMRAAGRKVRIVPKMHVHEGINATRTMLPQCRFDEERCKLGLHWLRLYQWGPPAASGAVKRDPLHNEASHAADALRGLAIAMKQPKLAPVKKDRPKVYAGAWS
jgi:phage terminase large subunit